MYLQYGYAAKNHGTTNVLDGGGALPLNPEGVFNLGKWLLDGNIGYSSNVVYESHDDFTGIIIHILWIGIAYAEEAILLLLFVKLKFGKTHRIIIKGIDIQ